MDWITSNLGPVWDIASQVIAGCAILAAITPTPKDDNALVWVRNVLDTLAFNFHRAKNSG